MDFQRIDGNMAVIMFNDGTRIMFSYGEPAAAYLPGRGYLKSTRYLSRSTNQHVVKFTAGNMAAPVDHSEILELAQSGH